MSANSETILFVPAGKIRCYIHGTLRSDTPEEHVRQRVARSLVEEYGYGRENIRLEMPIKIGSRTKRVDIAIFPNGSEQHTQQNIYIIVETKKAEVRRTDRDNGVEQLKSYLAACHNAQWGLWVGSELVAFQKEIDPEKAKNEPFPESIDIPAAGDIEPRRLNYIDLVPATEGLRSVFKRCHDYLHVNGNLGKEKAFFELLKLIFCKLYDEENTSGELAFSVTTDERKSDLGQRKLKARMNGLFDEVKKAYPLIFPSEKEIIELDDRSLAYVVAELQKYSFQQTASDIKGEAYEEIVGVTSRRDHGAFFTPRNVCDLAANMVFSTYKPDKLFTIKVLDPACGTGGFLRAALLSVRKGIEDQELKKHRGNLNSAWPHISERLRKYCNSHIFGIDKLPELVRAAQMNMALHGDGSSNIVWENSLLSPGEWREESRKKIKLNSFDVVFTNPPFGAKLPIDDPHVLDRYDLTKYEAKAPRSSLPPEQLFVQRCLDFLKEGGRMAIVLPDSILSNPGLAWLRRWLLSQAYVIASVDLPREMFAKSDTHTMTSVLVLQKFTKEEKRLYSELGHPQDYEIFMALAEKVGWDLRGQPVYSRTPEGELIERREMRKIMRRNAKGDLEETLVEVEEPIIEDNLPEIVQLFKNWIKNNPNQRWNQ
jgi:type I restriction enzyme M protein